MKKNIYKESFTEWIIYSTLALTVLFSQYFDLTGFSPVEIGVLVATMPAISLISNPFWFKMTEKIGSRKTAMILTIITVAAVWLIFILDGFILKFISVAFSGFFLSAILPITESRVVYSVKNKGGRFDHARLWGTVGYSITAVITGFTLRFGLIMIFVFLSTIVFISFLINTFLYREESVKDEEIHYEISISQKRNGSLREFVIMMIPTAFALSLVGFISAFLPMHINKKGFDIATVGLTFSIMAFCEVPFLFFAEKIIKKIGNLKLLISGIFLLGLRTFLIPFADSFPALIAVQMIHGWNYIVIYFSLYNYIHYKLPGKYSTKAQAVFWMVAQGISFFMGSTIGGVVVDKFGLEKSFTIFGVFGMILVIPLVIYAFGRKKNIYNRETGL